MTYMESCFLVQAMLEITIRVSFGCYYHLLLEKSNLDDFK